MAAAAALTAVVLTPATADAGWRGGYWGGGWGPGFGIYVGPRPYYRKYGYGYGYRPYITTVTPIAMGRAGNIVAAGIIPREEFLPGLPACRDGVLRRILGREAW